jgi:hypothetical protein
MTNKWVKELVWSINVLEVISTSDYSGLNTFIEQLHTLPVLHFNRCLTTEYSETTAHFNGNFDTDNQIYVPYL